MSTLDAFSIVIIILGAATVLFAIRMAPFKRKNYPDPDPIPTEWVDRIYDAITDHMKQRPDKTEFSLSFNDPTNCLGEWYTQAEFTLQLEDRLRKQDKTCVVVSYDNHGRKLEVFVSDTRISNSQHT